MAEYPLLIKDSSLEDWKVIGSGGFGQIYKARHRQWCYDVAIKILHYDNGNSSSLLRDVKMMHQGINPHVIQVFGVFQGRPPSSGPSAQLGLVMEYMERGCLASLQDTLRQPLPWPLVFRLAHQVALGVNFLHSLSPALVLLDLKPSNVLLDSDLKAKLTDFSLARFYQSVAQVSKEDSEQEGRMISYMPPEAFKLSYSPTRAFDIYSYGILLWSIVTGKQPYANAMSSKLKLRIVKGDRPPLEELMYQAKEHAELTELMELMVRCWDANATNRPSSFECATKTEKLYKIHKDGILDAVDQILRKLSQDRKTERILTNRAKKMSEGPVAVIGPDGQKTWIDLDHNINTVDQLRQKAVKTLPWFRGQDVDNIRLTLDGKTLDDPSLLSRYGIRTSSTIHLVRRVHGGALDADTASYHLYKS